MLYYREDISSISHVYSVPEEYSKAFKDAYKDEIASKQMYKASSSFIRSMFEGCCKVDYKLHNSIKTVKMIESKAIREGLKSEGQAGHAGANSWISPDYLQVELGHNASEANMLRSLDLIEGNTNR